MKTNNDLESTEPENKSDYESDCMEYALGLTKKRAGEINNFVVGLVEDRFKNNSKVDPRGDVALLMQVYTEYIDPKERAYAMMGFGMSIFAIRQKLIHEAIEKRMEDMLGFGGGDDGE